MINGSLSVGALPTDKGSSCFGGLNGSTQTTGVQVV